MRQQEYTTINLVIYYVMHVLFVAEALHDDVCLLQLFNR